MSITPPTHYYKCEEASGSLLDFIATQDFTDNNSCGSTTGKINNGRTFASASSRYFSSTHADFTPAGHFSVCLWVKFTSSVTATQVVLGHGSALAQDWLLVLSVGTGKRMGFYDSAAGTLEDSTFGDLALNTWYFVAFGWDGTNKWLSINNGTRQTQAKLVALPSVGTELDIGRRPLAVAFSYMDGVVDEIAWGGGLDWSDGDLATPYNGGSGSQAWITSGSPPDISYTTPVAATVGIAISTQSPTNIGGASTNWTLNSGTLPPGLSLNATTGAITGTPTTANSYTPEIRATNADGSDDFTITFNVAVAAPDISYTTPVNATQNVAIATQSPTNTGGPSTTWTVDSGSLPSGLSLNGTTGAITGTPDTVETQTPTIKAANVTGSDTFQITFNILAPATGGASSSMQQSGMQQVSFQPAAFQGSAFG